LSIGYTPVSFDFDPRTGVRRIHEVSLWEVSLVTFPANTRAGVTVVKSADRHEAPAPLLLQLAEALERAEAALHN